MSQRILIHLRGVSSRSILKIVLNRSSHNFRSPELSEPADITRFENIILTRPLQPGRSVVNALRSQCDLQKTPIDMEYSPGSPRELELDVQVVVEQSVTVDYDQSSRRRLTGV